MILEMTSAPCKKDKNGFKVRMFTNYRLKALYWETSTQSTYLHKNKNNWKNVSMIKNLLFSIAIFFPMWFKIYALLRGMIGN